MSGRWEDRIRGRDLRGDMCPWRMVYRSMRGSSFSCHLAWWSDLRLAHCAWKPPWPIPADPLLLPLHCAHTLYNITQLLGCICSFFVPIGPQNYWTRDYVTHLHNPQNFMRGWHIVGVLLIILNSFKVYCYSFHLHISPKWTERRVLWFQTHSQFKKPNGARNKGTQESTDCQREKFHIENLLSLPCPTFSDPHPELPQGFSFPLSLA